MRANTMAAMILAGGRGSRLLDLTKKVAKPAVHFGGKYRIIDFPLSNCANSGISTVGVLTQYESVILNAYVAKDQFWGLDTNDGGVYVLTPRERDTKGLEVYRGTADAITANLDFLDQINPEYVLILSGDHIYKMNYDKMLAYHKEKMADATIAVLQVSLKEATRFGIMNCDKDDMIEEFEEKPAHPKSNLASMGIYIFTYKTLRKYLLADDKDPNSNHDFGKDIIPAYLRDNRRLAAYRFKGYWKDVGTVDSLWESNMDLLKKNSPLDLGDQSWKIYTEDVNALPQYIGEDAKIENAYITQGSVVLGEVRNSVLGTNCVVGKGAQVVDSVIQPGAKIGEGAKVTRCIVADDVEVAPGAVVGNADSEHIELVAKKYVE
ncbi:MAG: glucose-1-phosphate adenylyltransferase [Solobacterium sp.]|nr:glucose-1-phosphate adenylyltransferase [Solobacterium sp.]MCH4049430.1 glucose-1-phosphate adenylyltransferase [Solobacterium sp.]MCH4075286.1 glucose-1-phosphate adenylyltransferase [Solobacterium sp.]MCI1314368.1 glucose-1-phosphate adenylyltransferase [Solobacterium sp.]MCI1346523.1 glucose-1-phosphate adenylyltransferase [Solobacterium sp.]